MNKMFKKLLAVAAVVATAACLSVSVFAEGETAALTQAKDGVTVSGYAAVEGATQYTVMLFEDSFTTNYDVSKIFYINQGDNPSALLTNMLFKATGDVNELPPGDYTVRIGNDKGTTVDVDLKVVAENNTVKLIFGDVNGDKVANADDALYIAAAFTGGEKAVGGIYNIGEIIGTTELVFGDVNGDKVANADDALYIAASFTGGEKAVGGLYNIGAEYEVPAK